MLLSVPYGYNPTVAVRSIREIVVIDVLADTNLTLL
jgi:hypothetical protein